MGRIVIISRFVGLAFVSLLLLATTASAATLTVTTTTDSSTPGSGSLRTEIAAASPGDTVMVPANTKPYTITLAEIPIANAITIDGGGQGSTTIEVTGGASRAFHITTGVPSTSTVTFENLTIEGGSTTTEPGGGGILDDQGLLTLDHVTMTGNSAELTSTSSQVGGGAIYSSGGLISLTDSNLSANTVTDSGGTSVADSGGGAVFQNGNAAITISGSTIDANHTTISSSRCCIGGAIYENADAAITVTGSHLDNNTLSVPASTDCCNGGGAIYSDGSTNGSTTISGSTLDGDTATVTDTSCCDGGGAIFQDTSAPVVIDQRSTLSNDKTTVASGDCCSGGGAISSFSGVQISDSTVNSNNSDVTGANCCDGGGAVNVDSNSSETSMMLNTEMSRNISTVDSTGASADNCCNGGGAFDTDASSGALAITSSDLSLNTSNVNSTNESGGGAVFDRDGGHDAFLNSTFSGNATNGSGALDGGGAIYFDRPDTFTLSSLTVASNTAANGGGGGVFGYGATIDTKNSILAANDAHTGTDCSGATDSTSSTPVTFTSLGHNLEDSPDTCTFTQPTDKVVAASSLGLGPLANNGGSTMTRSLLSGSPAINAIPIASCTDQTSPTPVPITTDQRGISRPQPDGGNCDIGAFEFGDADLALTGSAVPFPKSLKVGQHATIGLTVSNAGPVPATTTTVAVSLPSGLKLISGGSCSTSPCALGAVLVHAGAPATFVLEATKPGKLIVKATAATTSIDPNGANNSLSFTINAILTPTLTQLSQSHKTWSEGSKLARLAGKHTTTQPPVGTTFSFKLNEAAKVTFKFAQGHKTRGTLTFNAKSGNRKLSFDGKLSHSKKLKPGSYTVLITAEATGLTSKTAKLSFKIAAG